MRKRLVCAVAVCMAVVAWAGCACAMESEVDMLLDLMVKKNIVSKEDADVFRAEVAIKKQDVGAKEKIVPAPDWTQNIKWGGDVRYRTRTDNGKTAQNQPQTTAPTNASDLRKQRIQESIRGRFAMEGKVNDSTYAGVRFAGGNTNPRSTDDTITGYFNKAFVMFDQYYMRYEAPKALVMRYGEYFSELKFWAGKFGNPLEITDLTWDSDISPGGLMLQYVSPRIRTGSLPDCTVFSNIGMLWIDESAAFNTDPLLWVFQGGIRTDPFGPARSSLTATATFYNFANLQGKTPNANSAGTNSRTWLGTYGYGVAASSLGTYAYEYNIFDLLVRIDNEEFGDCAFPHGFVFDFIYNASVSSPDTNRGALLGGYVGKKKLKDVGDWKVSADWRFIERDAIPDFMPDSNFYGFGTYVSTDTIPNVNGIPAAGGTNGRGIRTGAEYQMLKNTCVNVNLFWMEPIKAYDKRNPWTEFLFDVITKF